MLTPAQLETWHRDGFLVLPGFKGVDAVYGIEGLVNPRGFVLIDKHQRNPAYPNVFVVGVCVAMPPVEVTPVPTGIAKLRQQD